jgi:hypothetical protein
MQQLKLEDLIREKISLGKSDSRGFYSMKCQCCNDYKVRAGFKFDNNSVIYNCWNCSTAGKYEEFSGKISRNMRSILNAYDMDDSEISTVVNSAFFFKKEKESETISLASLVKINTLTPAVKLPDKTFRLGGTSEFLEYQEKIVAYLVERKINIDKYPFYFSLSERYINRVIIPFYRNGELIYWQARAIDDGNKKRYENAIVGREAVIFNIDKLYNHTNAPLFVTEGVFDAMMFDGVAILGSKLSPAKLELLKKSARKLIFVIDKDKNGEHLANEVIRNGWQISFAPNGTEDLNKSVQQYGLIYVADKLVKSICRNSDAERLAINLNCK